MCQSLTPGSISNTVCTLLTRDNCTVKLLFNLKQTLSLHSVGLNVPLFFYSATEVSPQIDKSPQEPIIGAFMKMSSLHLPVLTTLTCSSRSHNNVLM